MGLELGAVHMENILEACGAPLNTQSSQGNSIMNPAPLNKEEDLFQQAPGVQPLVLKQPLQASFPTLAIKLCGY